MGSGLSGRSGGLLHHPRIRRSCGAIPECTTGAAVAGVGEFVFAEPQRFISRRNPSVLWIGSQEIEEALHVVLVRLPDLRPAGVARVG